MLLATRPISQTICLLNTSTPSSIMEATGKLACIFKEKWRIQRTIVCKPWQLHQARLPVCATEQGLRMPPEMGTLLGRFSGSALRY